MNKNISKIRKQIIKSVFDFDYKKESGICKYSKLILNNNTTYNCTDIDVHTNDIQINSNDTKININYLDIKQLILF